MAKSHSVPRRQHCTFPTSLIIPFGFSTLYIASDKRKLQIKSTPSHSVSFNAISSKYRVIPCICLRRNKPLQSWPTPVCSLGPSPANICTWICLYALLVVLLAIHFSTELPRIQAATCPGTHTKHGEKLSHRGASQIRHTLHLFAFFLHLTAKVLTTARGW